MNVMRTKEEIQKEINECEARLSQLNYELKRASVAHPEILDKVYEKQGMKCNFLIDANLCEDYHDPTDIDGYPVVEIHHSYHERDNGKYIRGFHWAFFAADGHFRGSACVCPICGAVNSTTKEHYNNLCPESLAGSAGYIMRCTNCGYEENVVTMMS